METKTAAKSAADALEAATLAADQMAVLLASASDLIAELPTDGAEGRTRYRALTLVDMSEQMAIELRRASEAAARSARGTSKAS